LKWFHETAMVLRDLLTETGCCYVHVGWQVSGGVRLILDEVFGYEHFLNEIVWKRTPHAGSSKARSTRFPINHESIFLYSKSQDYVFENQYVSYDEQYVKRFSNPDADPRGPWQSVSLKTYSEETLKRLKVEKKLIPPQQEGAGWRYKWFLAETAGKQIEGIWTDVGAVNSMAEERTDYPTQKPEALLDRLLKASSKERDLILDCFVGSGTTAAGSHATSVVSPSIPRESGCSTFPA
jgi:adenine specific DNA methylase Mod